ncbi:MAG: hypothetical protein A3H67_02360 [Candidatus Buchananbacteria bacterium RIFCSPLOWO2_02_FULL_46_11b]|uniref:DUF559 domain-containing protein n=1 Tax=Candidatus Buchananbacteria bacterium RIFCSPLOWO2_02_FULL_46_11b TaxID=1797548 RepID=A0A1G1YYP2_9BACT|nr:MAG: hypothetical protein A3H67_02360 [Candidatus Buchananbacteria bacterium RIFCSPLOWO2_02_FULL_46_11b]
MTLIEIVPPLFEGRTGGVKIFNRKEGKRIRQKLRSGNYVPVEALVWSIMKKKQLKGYKFRRQYGAGKYVIDFYCPKLKLAVEIDGQTHSDQMARIYDCERQKYIESLGIKFLRFSNYEVYENLDAVIEKIKAVLP